MKKNFPDLLAMALPDVSLIKPERSTQIFKLRACLSSCGSTGKSSMITVVTARVPIPADSLIGKRKSEVKSPILSQHFL
jgi:hypothetical protein